MAKVSVLDPLAAVRRSIERSLLDRDHEIVDPEDGPDVIVVTDDGGDHCPIADALAAGAVVVALTDDDGSGLRRALGAGAVPVPRSAEPEVIVRAVDGALHGDVTLPVTVVRQLVGPIDDDAGRLPLGPEEARWIQRLAAGTTVASLAGDVGYSEREMFRILHRLYERMGARNRTEALVLATKWGLLDG